MKRNVHVTNKKVRTNIRLKCYPFIGGEFQIDETIPFNQLDLKESINGCEKNKNEIHMSTVKYSTDY